MNESSDNLRVLIEKVSDAVVELSKLTAVHATEISSLKKNMDSSDIGFKELNQRITEMNKDINAQIAIQMNQMDMRFEDKFKRQIENSNEKHLKTQREIREERETSTLIEKRVRTLENWRWWLMGVGIGSGACLGILIDKFLKLSGIM